MDRCVTPPHLQCSGFEAATRPPAHYPVRGAITWKCIVGTNVAADAPGMPRMANPPLRLHDEPGQVRQPAGRPEDGDRRQLGPGHQRLGR